MVHGIMHSLTQNFFLDLQVIYNWTLALNSKKNEHLVKERTFEILNRLVLKFDMIIIRQYWLI